MKLVIDNWAEVMGATATSSRARAPVHPHTPELRPARSSCSARELWIERDDFVEVPPKGYFRLFPGNKVRLKYGYVVECTGCDEGRRRQRHRGARAATSPTPRAARRARTRSR